MTEIRASTAAAGRPLMSTASHLVARAARCFRLEWRRREEGSAVCLLVVRSGLATARPAVTLALVGATLLASSASLIGMTYLNRDPILSVRKTLALTAARPLPQDEPGESNLKRASSVPAWVVEHFSPNVQNPGWAVITVAETGLGSPAFPLQAQSPLSDTRARTPAHRGLGRERQGVQSAAQSRGILADDHQRSGRLGRGDDLCVQVVERGGEHVRRRGRLLRSAQELARAGPPHDRRTAADLGEPERLTGLYTMRPGPSANSRRTSRRSLKASYFALETVRASGRGLERAEAATMARMVQRPLPMLASCGEVDPVLRVERCAVPIG